MSKLTEFLKLSGQVKKMMLEAYLYSAKYRYIIMHKEFKEYCEDIGTFQYETPKIRISDQIIADTEWAVNAACKRAAWDSKCLDRALTAKKILNKRGYPCTMYMGLKMNEKNELTAHAWLRCGTNWVSGGNGDGYAVTGIYGDKKELLETTFAAEYDDTDESIPVSDYSVENLSIITDVSNLLSEQGIPVLLLPLDEVIIRFLVKEADFNKAVSILEKHSSATTSVEIPHSEGSSFLISNQSVLLLKKASSDYDEKFTNLWKRHTTRVIDNNPVSVLGNLDEICNLFRILNNEAPGAEKARKSIELLIKEQRLPLDLLYNHMQSRNLHQQFIHFLIDLYCRKGNKMKPYTCPFLSVKAEKNRIVIKYDQMLDFIKKYQR